MIDLRSDTVTKPTAAMLEAMTRAEVGDDVYGEDPTVRALEERIAALTGKEAALFVTSGTMGNQLALLVHTRRGDEVVVGEGAHVSWYESGAGAALAGVQFAVAGQGGFFGAEELDGAIKPPGYHYPRTSLVCFENTHNRAGGRVFPQATLATAAARAHTRGLRAHLDGARLWNAAAATGDDVRSLAAPVDTVNVCFSKGLGAPVGSALAGPRDLMRDAHRWRKMLGGGMRQAGVLAAAALYALDHHRERLVEDQRRARSIAERLAGAAGVEVDAASVETNIVNVDLPGAPSDAFVAAARARGVLVGASGPHRVRVVLHLDVDDAAATEAGERLVAAAGDLSRPAR